MTSQGNLVAAKMGEDGTLKLDININGAPQQASYGAGAPLAEDTPTQEEFKRIKETGTIYNTDKEITIPKSAIMRVLVEDYGVTAAEFGLTKVHVGFEVIYTTQQDESQTNRQLYYIDEAYLRSLVKGGFVAILDLSGQLLQSKNTIEDLQKANHELKSEIEELNEVQATESKEPTEAELALAYKAKEAEIEKLMAEHDKLAKDLELKRAKAPEQAQAIQDAKLETASSEVEETQEVEETTEDDSGLETIDSLDSLKGGDSDVSSGETSSNESEALNGA